LDRTKPGEPALIAPVDPVTLGSAHLDNEWLERFSRQILFYPLEFAFGHSWKIEPVPFAVSRWPGEDPEEWEKNFLGLLEANGREVYASSWDSGGMCVNGVESIEEFLGRCWARKSIEGTSGPYESFAEVFDDEYFRGVGSATESIWCCEMATEELLSKLILDKEYLEPGFTVKINGKPYVVTEEFRLVLA
jgi:hypothetical protein